MVLASCFRLCFRLCFLIILSSSAEVTRVSEASFAHTGLSPARHVLDSAKLHTLLAETARKKIKLSKTPFDLRRLAEPDQQPGVQDQQPGAQDLSFQVETSNTTTTTTTTSTVTSTTTSTNETSTTTAPYDEFLNDDQTAALERVVQKEASFANVTRLAAKLWEQLDIAIAIASAGQGLDSRPKKPSEFYSIPAAIRFIADLGQSTGLSMRQLLGWPEVTFGGVLGNPFFTADVEHDMVRAASHAKTVALRAGLEKGEAHEYGIAGALMKLKDLSVQYGGSMEKLLGYSSSSGGRLSIAVPKVPFQDECPTVPAGLVAGKVSNTGLSDEVTLDDEPDSPQNEGDHQDEPHSGDDATARLELKTDTKTSSDLSDLHDEPRRAGNEGDHQDSPDNSGSSNGDDATAQVKPQTNTKKSSDFGSLHDEPDRAGNEGDYEVEPDSSSSGDDAMSQVKSQKNTEKSSDFGLLHDELDRARDQGGHQDEPDSSSSAQVKPQTDTKKSSDLSTLRDELDRAGNEGGHQDERDSSSGGDGAVFHSKHFYFDPLQDEPDRASFEEESGHASRFEPSKADVFSALRRDGPTLPGDHGAGSDSKGEQEAEGTHKLNGYKLAAADEPLHLRRHGHMLPLKT
mmetsp:Transcript_104174/g.185033  ORF Transcript_104174/g.185033 Transcript_104174/m.185033 type:complete len:628 (-) Transcript_104174:136-2019(-)